MVSLGGHLAVVMTVAFAPELPAAPLPRVVTVELMAPIPGMARAPKARKVAKPAPAEALPAPKPPPPKPQKIVLPEQPTAAKKPRQAKKVRKKPPELDYQDVMAKLRDELGEDTPPAEEPAAEPDAVAESAPSQAGIRLSPEEMAWVRKVEIHVRRQWVTPPEFLNRRLGTQLCVELSTTGQVLGEPDVNRSSGDPFFDDNAVRAILRSSPLPPPPRQGRSCFFFDPDGRE